MDDSGYRVLMIDDDEVIAQSNHAIFNILVDQTGPAFWIGSAVPSALVLIYLLFLRRRLDFS